MPNSPSAPPPGFAHRSPRPDADPRPVQLLVLDVDGVMTDGSILLDDQGVETKRFFVRDGQGIAAWLKLGFKVAIITRRGGSVTHGSTGRGECVLHRCRELGIDESLVIRGAADKSTALDHLLKLTNLRESELAYIGDDWPDIRAMRRVGYPIAVADAALQVKHHAAYITTRPGGHGAIREAIEHIVHAKGLTDRMLEYFC